MFNKKKLKSPIMIVRPPAEINKEYSEIAMKLGSFEVEKEDIRRKEEQMLDRLEKIEINRKEILDRIPELSQEMDAAQKEISRKLSEPKIQVPPEGESK